MARSAPGSTAKLGLEPITLLKITWAADKERWYADRTFSHAEGRIIKASGLTTSAKVGVQGSTGSISITLDDNDGALKAIFNTTDIHKSACVVYQCFGMDFNSKFELFRGQVNSPVIWTDNPRTLSFEIVAEIESKEIGYSPEQGDYEYVPPEEEGQPWPLCFGSNIKYKALKITERPKFTCYTRYNLFTVQDGQTLLELADEYMVARREWELATLMIQANDPTQPAPTYESYLDLQAQTDDALVSLLNTEEELIAKCPERYAEIVQFTMQAQWQKYMEVLLTEFLRRRDQLILDIRNQQIELENSKEEKRLVGIDLDAAKIIAAKQPGDDYTQAEIDSAKERVTFLEDKLVEVQAEIDIITFRLNIGMRLLNGDPLPPEATPNGGDYTTTVNWFATTIPNIWNAWIAIDDTDEAYEAPGLVQIIDFINASLAIIRTNTQSYLNILVQPILTRISTDKGIEQPQGVPLQIIIKEGRFEGYFENNDFVITNSFLPTETGIKLGVRPDNDLSLNHLYLEDASYNLKNKFCLLHIHTDAYNANKIIYVTDQDGTKCIFDTILWTPANLNEASTTQNPYVVSKDETYIQETCPVPLAKWMGGLGISGSTLMPAYEWGIDYGDTMYIADDYADLYLVSLNPVAQIAEVMANRIINGRKVLVPVPSRYYTKHLTYTIGTKTVSLLSFKRPLSQYQGENWEDDVYVSSKETTIGPNTADIIKYLVENYTNLTIDTTSYNNVKTQIANYPSHMRLTERGNCLQVIEEIARQARCGLYVNYGKVFFTYLSKEQTSVLTLDLENIAEYSIEVTPTEELVTKLTGEWRKDGYQEKPFKIVLRHNIPKYGLHEETENYYIYNIRELVNKSLTFWMIRESNTWKTLKIKAYLDTLLLEPYDTVLVDLPELSSSPVKCIVTNIEYDSSIFNVNIELWTPVRLGEMTAYPLAYPADSVVSYPTGNDQYVGGES